MKKKLMALAFSVAAAGLVFSMGQVAEAKVKVSSVRAESATGSSKTVYVAKGKSVKLTATVKVKPNRAANKKVSYKSSKSSIAVVNSKGIVKGKKLGTAKIIVRSKKNNNKKASITVKVVNPATKVALDKKKTFITIGGSVKLKATVKGKKNYCKSVVWTTSNKRVAAVSKSGVVKAKAAGKAVVRAVAADGTKKVAACLVVVTGKTTDLSSLNFRTYYNDSSTDVVVVSLNEAKTLTENQFIVKTKSRPDGQYIHTTDIASVVTANNIDFMITLNDSIYDGDFVQVEVADLDGQKAIEKEFKVEEVQNDVVVTGTVGKPLVSSQFGNGYESISLSSGSLPAGLSIDQQDGTIFGTPTALSDNQVCTLSLTSETGRIKKVQVTFLIGDKEHIIAQNKTFGNQKDFIVLASDYFAGSIEVVGGRGSYTYEMADDCNGMFQLGFLDSYFYVEADSGKMAAGTYYPKVRIKDAENTNLSTVANLAVVVTPSIEITSTVTNDKEISVFLYYRNTETGSVYYANSNTEGVYKTKVPSGIYEAYYYTTDETGKDKLNYLGRDINVTASAAFQYTVSDSYKFGGRLLDQNGELVDKEFEVELVNTSGKMLESRMGTEYQFSGYAKGNYIIKVYDSQTEELVGQHGVVSLSGNVIADIKLNYTNIQQ